MSTVRIQVRRGTAAEWTSVNPTLAAGELGVETDTRKIKIGTGSTAWTSLSYIAADSPAITEIAQDAIDQALSMGAGLTKSYNDNTNTISLGIDTNVIATNAYVDNAVGGLQNTVTSDYVLIADVGNAGGPAKLDANGNLLIPQSSIILEGSAADDYETTLTVTNPTADRTITFPNNSGTVVLDSTVDEFAQDAVNSALTAGTGLTKSYNDSANTITVAVDTNVIATVEALNSVVSSLNVHQAALAATTGNLNATYANGSADQGNGLGVGATLTMNSNGVLTIDDVPLEVGARVLVKAQTNNVHNGIYEVTSVGSAGSAAVLTRAEDYNNSDAQTPQDITKGDVVFITNGTINGSKQFSQMYEGGNADKSIIIGTDGIGFTLISGTGAIDAGFGLNKTETTLSVDTTEILSTADAASTYLSLADATSYLTTAAAASTYLTTTNAGTTYLTQSDANSDYLKISDAASTYIPLNTNGIVNSQIATGAEIAASKIAGTAVTQADTATVTNAMLAGSIANNKLANSTISGKSLGTSLDALTISTGLTGTSYNGGSAVTIAVDSTIATKSYADTAVSNHESDSTNIHGITDTANLVYTNDSRLSDTRTPTDNSVTNAKLADDAVDTAEIKDGAVTSAKIANGTIVNADINASAEIAQSKISGLTSDLSAKLDKSGGTMTGALTLSGAPSADLHAATKAYVDNVTAGLNFHQPVRVATTANITLSGTQTIDGVSLSVGDRVLVKDQTDQKENGIYVVASSTWSRATDADNSPDGELKGGDFTLVLEGTVNSSYGYVCANTSAVTIGSSNITYTPFNAAKAVTAGTGLTEPTAGTLAVDTSVIQARVSGVSDTEIGYLDGVTSAIQTQLDAKAPTASPTFTGTVTLSASGVAFTDGTQTKEGVPSRTPIISKTGNYTLSAESERDSLIEVDSTSPVTITIPTNSAVPFPVGTTLDILGINTGLITIAGDTGVTVNATPGLKLRTQWSSATLFKRATNSWVVYGDLKS